MGRSFDDVKKPDGDTKAQSSTQTQVSAVANTAGFGFFSIAESSSPTSSPSSGAQTSPESDTYVHETVESAASGHADGDIILGLNATEEPDNRVVYVPRGAATPLISAPWGLVDPLFKDMSQISRFYLFHCTFPVFCIILLRLLTDYVGPRQSTYGQRLCCIFTVQEPLAGYHFSSR